MPGFPPSHRKDRRKKFVEKEEKPPLHVIMNLICILIPALLSQQVLDYFQHQVELPTRGGAGSVQEQPQHKPFNLKLTLNTDDSFTIVNAKTLRAGERGLIEQGPGLVLPPGPDGRAQYKQLQLLLTKEKKERLEGQPADSYPDPDQITVSAPSSMKYQEIISALDYVRFQPAADDAEAAPLFTVITLSPGSVGG